MAKSYSVACPSCDASVTVKSGAASAKKKIECPKCKYRFVAPPPEEEEVDEPAAVEETDGGSKKKKKKGPGSTVLVGALLGVLAVGLLGAGGYFLFADGDDKTTVKNPSPRPGVRPNPPPTQPTPPDKETPKDKEPPKEQPKVKTPAGPPKDLTNMLPNDTVGVVRVNFDQATQQTPFFTSFFDASVQELFKKSLVISPEELAHYIHCVVGKDVREPFALIRTRKPIDLVHFWNTLNRKSPTRGPIRQREYFLLENNSFLTSIRHGLSGESLRTQIGLPAAIPPQSAATPEPPLAIHVYDSQTIVIAPETRMIAYLEDLQPGTDLPKYLTELTGGSTPEPKKPEPKNPKTPADPPKRKLFTTIKTYRTIDPTLKKILNQLEEDDRNEPAFVIAEIPDHRQLAKFNVPLGIKDLPANSLDFLGQVSTLGGSLTTFTQDKLSATLVVEFVTEDAAKSLLKDKLTPALTVMQTPLGTLLGTQFSVRIGGQPLTPPGTTIPGTTLPPGFPDGEGVPPRPGIPPVGGPTTVPDPKLRTSNLDITIVDRILTVSTVVQWNEELYRFTIHPGINRLAAQIKGKMTVLSGDIDWYSLARGARKINGIPPVEFPTGTIQREIPAARLGQPYPPETRVSFFAELLPYIGRPGLRSLVDPNGKHEPKGKHEAWYSANNLVAAEAWVPEFLVPYYPQSSWRATHPYAEGRSLGSTNYVGLAGIGLDAARYNPRDKSTADKLGMTGYNWSSRAADVTDGLSNTAYLVQVPPSTNRPWIVGGGATLTGVDENNPQAAFLVPTPEGKKGTYLLMGDGSVRFLNEKADPTIFKALITRAANDGPKDFDPVAPRVPNRLPEDNPPGVEPMPDPPKKEAPPPKEKPPEPAKKPESPKKPN